MNRIEQIAGALIFLLGLLDVFLTVLYARAGSGLFSRAIARVCRRTMLALRGAARRSRGMSRAWPSALSAGGQVFTSHVTVVLP